MTSGVGVGPLGSSMLECGLAWSCALTQSYCEFVSAAAMSCPEDSIAGHLSQSSDLGILAYFLPASSAIFHEPWSAEGCSVI